MKIFMICSKAFYDRIPPIKADLERIGHTIILPNCYDSPETEAKVRGTEEHANWKSEMIKHSEKVISAVDSVFVLNFDKNGVENYIGGATFLEMYDAFRLGKQVYMMNDIPKGMLEDEIIGFKPIIINGDLTKVCEPNNSKSLRAKYGVSTVCYLEKDNKVLFLKFDKKWGQVYCAPGGKMNKGESPLNCIVREFKEETGLTLVNPNFKGYSHWNWQDQEYGIIFFYTATDYTGELEESVEGKLSWIDRDNIDTLRQFDMNTKFNDLIFEDGTFEGDFKLNEDDTVKEYALTRFKNGVKC